MLPLLYVSELTRPSQTSMRYIGRLTKCVKCSVSMLINKDYQLSAVFAATDPLINEIQNQRFIKAKPNFTDNPQYFEIYNQSVSENGQVTITARHIKHCCYNNVLKQDISNGPQSNTPQGHWDFLTDPYNELLAFENNFSFYSNINEQVPMEIGYTKSDTLGMFLEELATASGGEYYYDNFNISLLSRLGAKKNYTLRWGRNIGSPVLSLSSATVYTHVIAYADFTVKYTHDGTDYEYPVRICSKTPLAIPNASSRLDKIYMYDATSTFKETTFDDVTSIGPFYDAYRTILDWRAYAFINSTAIKNVQAAESSNLKVTFRQPLDEMKEIALGDTVNIILKSGHTVEARITKTDFDVLAERWNTLEIGQQRILLSEYIAKTTR